MSVQITYNVVPPAGIPAVADKSSTIDVAAPSATVGHYAGVISALREAQHQLNGHLTTWKDAIGDAEKSKEDLGKVAYGQGKASRASRDAGVTTSAPAGADEDEDDEDEE